jgi:hypothetical protein
MRVGRGTRSFMRFGRMRQRLALDDRGAVIAADPDGRRPRRVVDEDAADVGFARQQVFGRAAAFRIEAQDAIARQSRLQHRTIALRFHVVGLCDSRAAA